MYDIPDYAAIENRNDQRRYEARVDRGALIAKAKVQQANRIVSLALQGVWDKPPSYSTRPLMELVSDELAGTDDFEALVRLLPALAIKKDASQEATQLLGRIAYRIADGLIEKADLDGRI